jgi:hypothetical protein
LVKEQISIEFKHNQRPTESAIDNEIRDARRQADYVLLHIRSNIKKGRNKEPHESRTHYKGATDNLERRIDKTEAKRDF